MDDALLEDGVADVRWLLHDALLAGARRVVVDLTVTRHLPASPSPACCRRTARAAPAAEQ